MLEYTADRRIAINKQDVTIGQLETRLRNIFEQRSDKTMFIVGDGSLKYKDIVDVIDAAKGAGVEKVGIVTEGMRKAPAGSAATSSVRSPSSTAASLISEAAVFFDSPTRLRARDVPCWLQVASGCSEPATAA